MCSSKGKSGAMLWAHLCLLVAAAFSQSAFAQHPLNHLQGEQIETRVTLDCLYLVGEDICSGGDPLGVDEAVFRWVLQDEWFADANNFVESDEGSYYLVTAEDLAYLELKIDRTDPEEGDEFLDVIIDGYNSYGVPVVIGTGPSADRRIEEVRWDFGLFDPDAANYDELYNVFGLGQALDFRNIVNVKQGAVGEFFKVELCCDYQVVSYSTDLPPEGKTTWDGTWVEALNYAQNAGGYLATLTSPSENAYVNTVVIPPGLPTNTQQAWIGGYYLGLDTSTYDTLLPVSKITCSPSTDRQCWGWVNGEGAINYAPFDDLGINPWRSVSNEPNNSGGRGEYWLATNIRGSGEWNDSTVPNDTNNGGFVIEYPGKVRVTRFIDDQIDAEALQDELLERTYLVSPFAAFNVVIDFNTRTVFENDSGVKEVFKVLKPGLFNLNVCIAPDPRDVIIENGAGRPPKGKGKPTGNGNGEGFSTVYNARKLYLSELAGTGTCTGSLDFPDDNYASWEALLGDISTFIGGEFRGFPGKFDIPDDGEPAKAGVWIAISVERSTAEIMGPSSSALFWDLLGIDYSDEELSLYDPTLFNTPLAFRALDLGSTNPQFGEWPYVEGDEAIVTTTQFNRSWSLTGRTTKAGPFRLATEDANGGKVATIESKFLKDRVAGTRATFMEAASICTFGNSGSRASEFAAFQDYFEEAVDDISDGNYALARDKIEDLAYIAYGEFSDAELAHPANPSFLTSRGFNVAAGAAGLFASLDPQATPGSAGCLLEANVSGNGTARLLNLAFLLDDRYEQAGKAPADYEPYEDRYGLLGKFKPHLRYASSSN